MEFSRPEILEWVASLLQGIFPTQGSNPGLPRCKQILYQLSYQGSPRILEWVAYPFFRGSFSPRSWTRVPSMRADLYQLSYHGSPPGQNLGRWGCWGVTEKFGRNSWQPLEIKKRESKVKWKMHDTNVPEKDRWRDEAISDNVLKWWQDSQMEMSISQ